MPHLVISLLAVCSFTYQSLSLFVHGQRHNYFKRERKGEQKHNYNKESHQVS